MTTKPPKHTLTSNDLRKEVADTHKSIGLLIRGKRDLENSRPKAALSEEQRKTYIAKRTNMLKTYDDNINSKKEHIKNLKIQIRTIEAQEKERRDKIREEGIASQTRRNVPNLNQKGGGRKRKRTQKTKSHDKI